MPKVKSYSAPWLSKNAPGYQLFEPSTESLRSRALSPAAASSRRESAPGPRRTIANRGTQVFVASGRDIRWGDLAYIKDRWTERLSSGKTGNFGGVRIKQEDEDVTETIENEDGAGGMRTIKTRCAEDIRQLIMSPNENLLAILTTHTVHICILPDSAHLTSQDTGPLKPKMFTLGPTTHVTSRSAVMSALWHPLGVNGSCLVTVTADAIVRLWELSTEDRWSFDTPTMSVDLKKLADGTNLDQDFSASTTNTNKAFSPDSFEMDVASASFAHRGSGGWNPMTLWIAMTEGDVYALCPLLPQRWAPPPTLIPSLSVSIVTTVGSIEDDPDVSEYEKLLAQQQLEWMGEIDAQEPHIMDSAPGDPLVEVYTRPTRPGVVPRLQGPFELESDPDTGDDLDTTITDITVIGKKTETADLVGGEEWGVEDLEIEERDREGASLPVVCLLSTSGQVRIYLDLDGIQAQWLPPRTKSTRLGRLLASSAVGPPSLLAFQAIDTMSPVEVSEESWPVFSLDVMSRYDLYVTHHAGIVSVSLAPWIFRLEKELTGESEAGTDFRVNLVVNSQSSRDRIFSQSTADSTVPLAAAVTIMDPDIGYFLLSSTLYDPVALTFDSPDVEVPPPLMTEDGRSASAVGAYLEREASILKKQAPPLDFYEPRPTFNPPHAFDEGSMLPNLLERAKTSRHRTLFSQEVRLSPLTLSVFTDAHKVLSDETYRLGVAAAEVFRWCAILQAELRQQIDKANEVKSKIDAINGAHGDTGEPDGVQYDRRIREARTRQDRLTERLDRLRLLAGKSGTRALSTKEKAWFGELESVEANVDPSAAGHTRQANQRQQQELWRRLHNVEELRAELTSEVSSINKAKGLASPSSSSSSSPSSSSSSSAPAAATPGHRATVRGHTRSGSSVSDFRIPNDIRRSKLQQVQSLLERETALVEAVTARLERLQTV
ncbi:nucleoporin NUP82 [Geosmithia morbida]|uniref:Nucleoporin NUP82 n=1 Tax=Geosmithia morbida TaxID=1094350 RepID=A0A9P4YV56_9HYPO|nr:nucleoporin NUP82 [Geosmithia morbida]KAF4123102.1 nucleoporin NUP82 [Geosmithia morbida]